MQISNPANKATLFSLLLQRIWLCTTKSMNHSFSKNKFEITDSEAAQRAGTEVSFTGYTTLYHMLQRHETSHAVQSLDSRLHRSLYKYTFNSQQNGCVHSSSVSHSTAAAAEGSAVSDPCTDPADHLNTIQEYEMWILVSHIHVKGYIWGTLWMSYDRTQCGESWSISN